MRSCLILACAVLCLSLSGCASILEGTSQEITVNTNPSGASCDIVRDGTTIAHIDKTPGAATIKKTKADIQIKCDKPGYQEAIYQNHSGMTSVSFGNAILGGLIGVAVDSASGADNKYTSPVNLSMVPAT
jgi:hypothetical protein